MHLSALSDGYLSDAIHDGPSLEGAQSLGVAHREGLVRGIAFAMALACPLALAALPAWLHRHAADASFAEFSGHPAQTRP